MTARARRSFTSDEYSQIAYEVITDSVRRLSREFGLDGIESDLLQGHFVDVLVHRLLPRDTRAADAEKLRAQLMGYFSARQRPDGTPCGAGWEAVRIRNRRRPKAPSPHEDLALVDLIADPAGDVVDVIASHQAELEDLAQWAHEAQARSVQERRRAQRRADALALLDEIGESLRPIDRRALRDRAAGLTYRAAAETELGGPVDAKAVNRRIQRYRRAWSRLNLDVALQLAPICPEPNRRPRREHRPS